MKEITLALALAYIAPLVTLQLQRLNFGTANRDEILRDIRRQAIVFVIMQKGAKNEIFSVVEELSKKHKRLLFPYPNRNPALIFLSFAVFSLSILILFLGYFSVAADVVRAAIPAFSYLDVAWIFPLFLVTLIFACIWLRSEMLYWAEMKHYREQYANKVKGVRLIVVEDEQQG